MGFEPPRTVLKLQFQAHELEGADIGMYVPSLTSKFQCDRRD